MIDDGLAELSPRSMSRLPSTCCRSRPGTVGTRAGPVLSAADSMRITVHGRGAHGSMPQAAVDPVVLAAMIVIRLQTVVSREIAPGEPAVLTVGSIQAGTKSNVIPDHAVLQLNIRTYSERPATAMLDAIRRIVTAECEASGSPEDPGVRAVRPVPAHRQRPRRHRRGCSDAFAAFFGDRAADAAAADRQRGLQRHPDARSACPTPTGVSAASTRTPTEQAAEQPAESPRTSRSTTPPPSPRSSNPPSTPAPRHWSSPPWPGWHRHADRARGLNTPQS